MTLIHVPTPIESATWPDELPARVVVPAGFTLRVPEVLDLTNTDVVINGTLIVEPGAYVLPPASETATGGVELATNAETVAGAASNLASTPAGVAAAIAAIGAVSVPFDDVSNTEIINGTTYRTHRMQLLSGGSPVSERVLVLAWPSNSTGQPDFSTAKGWSNAYSEFGQWDLGLLQRWNTGLPTASLLLTNANGRFEYRMEVQDGVPGSTNPYLAVMGVDGAVRVTDQWGTIAP